MASNIVAAILLYERLSCEICREPIRRQGVSEEIPGNRASQKNRNEAR
jgi:hypothetical protein